MDEQWRMCIYDGEIFENYEVSNFGRVRSLNYNRSGKIRLLKPSRRYNGYLKVNLSKDGKVKQCSIHRLVAQVWIYNDNPTKKTEVNHINFDTTCNRVDNLEWVTSQENTNHFRNDEQKVKQHDNKVQNALSKKVLCVETGQVFNSLKDATEWCGCSKDGIGRCCRGERKTCHGYHWKYID